MSAWLHCTKVPCFLLLLLLQVQFKVIGKITSLFFVVVSTCSFFFFLNYAAANRWVRRANDVWWADFKVHSLLVRFSFFFLNRERERESIRDDGSLNSLFDPLSLARFAVLLFPVPGKKKCDKQQWDSRSAIRHGAADTSRRPTGSAGIYKLIPFPRAARAQWRWFIPFKSPPPPDKIIIVKK